MKLWFEVLTGKQALLFHHMANYYEELGHHTVFTTRISGYTTLNLDRLDRQYHAVGEYGGASLKGKLVAGANRIVQLAELVDSEAPDLLVTFSSPDAARTAYGLGIPIVVINDTPHAEAVARLTISLSDYLIHPSSIPREDFERYGVTSFEAYNGVDEALWVKSFFRNDTVLNELGIKDQNYLVLRCEESKSAYFRKLFPEFDPGGTIVEEIVYKLKEKGLNYDIVAFPRYPEQEEILNDLDVIVPDTSVDTMNLLHHAKAVMTGGGTMGREAAMLGTPTIYTFPWELDVSRYISDMGFPLTHYPDHLSAPEKIIELASAARMEEDIRTATLDKMETPLDAFERVLSRMKV